METTNVIPRPEYLGQIERALGLGLIIVLTGQRRVGKSYLLRALKEAKEKSPLANVIFIDKEKREFDGIDDYRELNVYIASRHNRSRHNYILIDEVQEIAGFEKALRSWRQEPRTDVIVTGSNACMLNSQLTTLIGGRYRQIYIQPLSYTEFLLFHGLGNSDESLLKYLDFGGLPGLARIGLIEEDARKYQLDVYNTALFKDVIQRNEIRNATFLENLSRFVADNIGKPLSACNISNYMKSRGEKVTPLSVSNYLGFLTDAFVMRKVARYNIHGKRLLENNGKYYFEDVGIRNALAGGRRDGDIEKVIENVVYQELLRRGYSVEVGQLRAGEVDFVCSRPGKEERVYVQASYLIAGDDTRRREFGTLHNIPDNYPKYVVSMSPLVDRADDHGVVHLGLRRFLTRGLGAD